VYIRSRILFHELPRQKFLQLLNPPGCHHFFLTRCLGGFKTTYGLQPLRSIDPTPMLGFVEIINTGELVINYSIRFILYSNQVFGVEHSQPKWKRILLGGPLNRPWRSQNHLLFHNFRRNPPAPTLGFVGTVLTGNRLNHSTRFIHGIHLGFGSRNLVAGIGMSSFR
jgi:hypothetical protein